MMTRIGIDHRAKVMAHVCMIFGTGMLSKAGNTTPAWAALALWATLAVLVRDDRP